MSRVRLSSALFEQIGGVNWVVRPGYLNGVELPMAEQVIGDVAIQSVMADELPLTQALGVDTRQSAVSPLLPQEDLSESFEVFSDVDRDLPIEKKLVEAPMTKSNVVLLGAGLNAVWQDDNALAWQLWQNIMRTFSWDESQIVFFDTEHLVSEDMMFSTVEEVIDLGVEWVLTMDDEHPIAEQIAEGLQVISVPSLESMLSDPYAKQGFYQAVVGLSV